MASGVAGAIVDLSLQGTDALLRREREFDGSTWLKPSESDKPEFRTTVHSVLEWSNCLRYSTRE